MLGHNEKVVTVILKDDKSESEKAENTLNRISPCASKGQIRYYDDF